MTELNFHIKSITNSEIKFLLHWLVSTKNNLKELEERVEWPKRNAYYLHTKQGTAGMRVNYRCFIICVVYLRRVAGRKLNRFPCIGLDCENFSKLVIGV